MTLSVPSLLREMEHKALSRVALTGSVIDLGGDRRSDYLSYVKGSFSTTRVNFDEKAKPDILHDLEKPLPIETGSFDGAVLFNVLEHVYEYRAFLSETFRILKPGGMVLVVVPFLFPVHPSPNDFHRFTSSTLRLELERVGFREIVVTSLGAGVWSARYLLLDRLLPRLLRFCNFYSARFVALGLDFLTTRIARLLGKKYDPADYALGYLVTAHKP